MTTTVPTQVEALPMYEQAEIAADIMSRIAGPGVSTTHAYYSVPDLRRWASAARAKAFTQRAVECFTQNVREEMCRLRTDETLVVEQDRLLARWIVQHKHEIPEP